MFTRNDQNVEKGKISISQTNSKNETVISNKEHQGTTSALR